MTADTLAGRLSYLLLTSDWNRDQLIIVGSKGLGGRPHWLPAVVDRLLARYPTKPSDRPRELAAVIGAMSEFVDGVELDDHAGVNWTVSRIGVVDLDQPELRMADRGWPVPVIGTEAALADLLRVDLPVLLWLADPKGLQRRTPAGDLHPYRYRWLDRGQRLPRLLEIPRPLLGHLQRRLSDRLLQRIPVHPAAYGFVPGRDALGNASRHVGSDWVINFDLRAYFDSVRAGRVYGILRRAGYPEPVAHLITGLICQQTPDWVLRLMPPTADSAGRAWLRARLRTPHLPQGAPSSPAAANLVSFTLDRRLQGLADARAACYTRYADDLTFSGWGTPPGERFRQLVRTIIVSEGFCPNQSKERLRTRGTRQQVTGIVVNERTNLPRAEYDRLRAILHDAVRHGPGAANRDGHPDFRAHLEGRVGWAERLNPVRGARLRAQLDAIVW